jgi:hypothetical protein
MNTMHHIEFTEEYLKEAQRLALSQNAVLRFIFLSRWTMWPPAILIGGFMIFLFEHNQLSFPSGVFFGAMLVCCFVGPLLNGRNLAKTRRRHFMKSSVVTYRLDEQGMDQISPVSNSHLQWPAFSRVILYPQGVLLKMQSNAYMWLPDKSLTEGSPEDVRRLLADHVKDRVGLQH